MVIKDILVAQGVSNSRCGGLTVAVFTVLLLLTSPAFSITYALSGIFFPNEKFALLIITVIFALSRMRVRCSFVILCAVLGSFFGLSILGRLIGGLDVNRVDLNHLYLMVALPFYFSFGFYCKDIILKTLPYVVCVQLGFSIFQHSVCYLDECHLSGLFNNYPSQTGYLAHLSEIGFYRTFALFNESSQYGAFLVVFLVLVHQRFLPSGHYFLVCIAIADLVLGNSITAYLMVFVYTLFCITQVQARSLALLFLVLVSSFLILVNAEKIFHTLSLLQNTHPRLLSAIDNIKHTFNESPFFGVGLSWDRPSWDFLSIYFSGYGLFGVIGIWAMVIAGFVWLPVFYMSVFLVYSLTNGILLGAVNIFFILIAGALFSSRIHCTSSG